MKSFVFQSTVKKKLPLMFKPCKKKYCICLCSNVGVFPKLYVKLQSIHYLEKLTYQYMCSNKKTSQQTLKIQSPKNALQQFVYLNVHLLHFFRRKSY